MGDPTADGVDEREDADVWEAIEENLRVRAGRLKVRWVRGHADSRKAKRAWTKDEHGNIRADAICNALKGVRVQGDRLVLPRRRSWRVMCGGVEVVREVKTELREAMGAAKLLRYWRLTRRWGELADKWIGGHTARLWATVTGQLWQRVRKARCMYSMWQTADVLAARAKGCTTEQRELLARCELCGLDAMTGWRGWHLLAHCRHAEVVKLRWRLRERVSVEVAKLVMDAGAAALVMLP